MRLINIFVHIIEQAIAIRDMINSSSPQKNKKKKKGKMEWTKLKHQRIHKLFL